MKSRTFNCITAMTLFAVLAISIQGAAQEEQPAQQQNKSVPRYVLIDVGTFGGPNSYVNGWGEPFRWHKLFGHSFRFLKSVLASSSRVRGLGKGAMSPPFPRIAVDSLTCSLLVLNDRCLQ